jgi:hypothetical protein
MDPMFRNMASDDYQLYAGSPAVGHGTPVGMDMGALPFTPLGSPPTEVKLHRNGDNEWTVTWNDTGAAGYNVYVGTFSGLYTQRFDAGSATSYTSNSLAGNLRYFVAVSAYDSAGGESRLSSEVGYEGVKLYLPFILRKP